MAAGAADQPSFWNVPPRHDAETRRLSFKGKEIVRELFWTLFENTLEDAGRDRLLLFPRSMRAELDTLSARQAARAVCDYLATMTEGQMAEAISKARASSGR